MDNEMKERRKKFDAQSTTQQLYSEMESTAAAATTITRTKGSLFCNIHSENLLRFQGI